MYKSYDGPCGFSESDTMMSFTGTGALTVLTAQVGDSTTILSSIAVTSGLLVSLAVSCVSYYLLLSHAVSCCLLLSLLSLTLPILTRFNGV